MNDQVRWEEWTEARWDRYEYMRGTFGTNVAWVVRLADGALFGTTLDDINKDDTHVGADTCSLGPFATEEEAKAVVGAYLKLTGGVTLE